MMYFRCPNCNKLYEITVSPVQDIPAVPEGVVLDPILQNTNTTASTGTIASIVNLNAQLLKESPSATIRPTT